MTKEEAVIISAYTGYMLVDDFGAVHEFVEKLLGRPVWTHQFADPALFEEIRKECKPILPFVRVKDCEDKVFTNADRIRAMSDDELRNFLCGLMNCSGCTFGSSSGCTLKAWLQMPAEEDLK